MKTSNLRAPLVLCVSASAVCALLWLIFHPLPFDVEDLKKLVGTLADEKVHQPIGFFFVFFASYVVVTALCIPLEVPFALATGALYGVTFGTPIASFAAAIGATLAFLSARFILRGWLSRLFYRQMKAINEGFAADGVSYLVTMRLLPVVPFGLCNILMGQTSIATRTFYVVTQLCMLFATIMFVNAGQRLAHLHSFSDLASVPLVLSLAGLATVPWIAKCTLKLWQKSQKADVF